MTQPEITSVFLRKTLAFSLATIILSSGFSSARAAGVGCLNTSEALAYWRPLREAPEMSSSSANSLALELLSCLGSPNPELRDQIGYELYVEWLRNDRLTDATRHALLRELSIRMRQKGNDVSLSRSFSALVLGELMRSDANKAFMSSQQRQGLLDDAIETLRNEQDFRGLVADIGWVHPVAHLSDLLWRFALHQETTPAQASSLLLAVRSKVAPVETSYTFNESDRLARVVSTLISRQLLDVEITAEWIESFSTPLTMEMWSDAFRTPAGMAELHNTKQFLRALSDQLATTNVADAISEPLAALVQGFTQLI